ncbi:MAG: hypothetical protein ABIQ18_14160 [Umezawaea sp.]
MSATSGAVRSVHPTTAPTRSDSSATARNSGVSSATVMVCTSTVRATPAASASGARSATPKFLRSAPSGGSVIQPWSRTPRSQKWW